MYVCVCVCVVRCVYTVYGIFGREIILRTFIHTHKYGVYIQYTVFLAGRSSYVRPYTHKYDVIILGKEVIVHVLIHNACAQLWPTVCVSLTVTNTCAYAVALRRTAAAQGPTAAHSTPRPFQQQRLTAAPTATTAAAAAAAAAAVPAAAVAPAAASAVELLR